MVCTTHPALHRPAHPTWHLGSQRSKIQLRQLHPVPLTGWYLPSGLYGEHPSQLPPPPRTQVHRDWARESHQTATKTAVQRGFHLRKSNSSKCQRRPNVPIQAVERAAVEMEKDKFCYKLLAG